MSRIIHPSIEEVGDKFNVKIKVLNFSPYSSYGLSVQQWLTMTIIEIDLLSILMGSNLMDEL
jgi:hypothetical protein